MELSQSIPQVLPKISIIRREELNLRGYWRLDSNTSIVSAEYNGKSVVVRKYGSDKRRWVCDDYLRALIIFSPDFRPPTSTPG
jgi:hypothetical protein